MSAARAPGRPRSAEADVAIVRATLEVLAEDGYRGLSVEKVRARAGVGKATIYRRYPSRQDLVKAAIGHLHQDLGPPEDRGSIRADFDAVATAVGGAIRQTEGARFMARMLAEAAQDADVHAIFTQTLVEPRRQTLRTIVERGIARGEVRDDVDPDVAVDMIAGPMIYRLLLGGIEPEALPDRAREVLDILLEGLRRR